MIKYVELTAPDASAFRQVKILSIECQEGDLIKEGDTLFRVQSGSNEIDLPSTKTGRIVELIVTLNENITLSTALVLLETVVEGSTASKPLNPDDGTEKTSAYTEELPLEDVESLPSEEEQAAKPEPKTTKVQPKAKAEVIKKSNKPSAKSDGNSKKSTRNTKAAKKTSAASLKSAKVTRKEHQQQSLDLVHEGVSTSEDSTAGDDININQEVATQTIVSTTDETNNHEQPSLTMSTSSIIEVNVPDIGADSAKVIEILVSVGDRVSIEDPLVTLESDKASMDVPSPNDGVIKSIAVQVDQDISEGTLIVELETTPEQASEQAGESPTTNNEPVIADAEKAQPVAPAATSSSVVEVHIPDIGGDSAKVIEVLTKVGDVVEVEDALVTLESDKASMDVPTSVKGVVQSIEVSVDQDVSEGTLLATILTESVSETVSLAENRPEPAQAQATKKPAPTSTSTKAAKATNTPMTVSDVGQATKGTSHASPSIRRFARELGVELTNVIGSGRKNRVTHEDVKRFVKGALNAPKSASPVSGGAGIPPVPAQDFSKFGDVDIQPLNRIKRLTAENLHRSWLNVPHVTHNDESNISDLESFRKQLNAEYVQQKREIKLSPLAFIVKAVVNGLQMYPQFNSSLEAGGENLIYKKYINIGIAVETPNGLVVPVIKDADKKSVAEIATEMGDLAKKARDKKLTMNDMSGACITISSLGGIGGTSFTPIVNAPEVAILGVSRSKMQPVWNGSEFEPGMMLPLSLSYDHRVIDGAEAARFTRHIAAVLEDVRRLTV